MEKLIHKSERIFVAGASGMVGSAVTRRLLKKGYGLKSNGGEILTPSSKELNLKNRDQVKEWFRINNPSVVILAAAKVGGILANSSQPVDFLLNNLKIQINVIETAYEFKVKRFLFLGSSCIYPKNSPQPIKEEHLLTGPLETTNQWYALAKITGLKLCEALRIEKNFDAITLMPTNLYGPGDNYDYKNSHVFAAFIRRFYEAKIELKNSVTCWGSGEPFREFMHVDDLANAAVFCLENWNPNAKDSPKDESGNILYFLNVGTGEEISIKGLALKIAKYIGYKGKIKWDLTKPDGTLKKLMDISKIKNLGWEAQIDLEKGIEDTCKLYHSEKNIN